METKDTKLIDLARHVDDRGYLFEVVHKSDDFVTGRGQEIRQVYIVGDPVRGTIRAYHCHQFLHDWFCIIHGSAKFVLLEAAFEDREALGAGDASKIRRVETVTLTSLRPQLLVVPPAIYHGWMSLEDDTILLSNASHEYVASMPDEWRIPYDIAGDVWRIAPR